MDEKARTLSDEFVVHSLMKNYTTTKLSSLKSGSIQAKIDSIINLST
jgi:hypothetical protein